MSTDMPVTIRHQSTPNPNAGKFTADRRIVEGRESRSYYSALQAAEDPLALELFRVTGVANVFMADDFVTVTRDPAVSWDELVPDVIEAMQRMLA